MGYAPILTRRDPSRLSEFNVRGYGATGDGTTDDATAIQDALDTVSAAGGGTVVFPAGTYGIATPLDIPDDVRVVGHGGATIKALSSITWTSGGLLTLGDRARLTDLVIDGNRDNLDLNTGRQLVAVLDSDDVVIEGCTIKESTGIGVYVTSGQRTVISGNDFSEIDVCPVYLEDFPTDVVVSSDTDDIIDTRTTHTFVAGDEVQFDTLNGGSGLSTRRRYYVLSTNLTATTFQIGLEPGGSALSFGSDITGTPVTLTTSAAADDIVDTSGAHGFSAYDKIVFTSLTGGTGLSTNTVYWVSATSLAATTFRPQVPFGADVDFSTDITAGTVMKLPATMSLFGHKTLVENNTIRAFGRHAIVMSGHNRGVIRNNRIHGNLEVGMQCDFSGTAVTKDSGPSFKGLRVGNYLIHAANATFTESLITAISSDTALTISGSVTASNVTPVAGGAGDMIGVGDCDEALISGNTLHTGASIGIALSAIPGPMHGCIITDNLITNLGGPGICVESSPYDITGVSITDNQISNVGRRGSINGYNVGIMVSQPALAMTRVWVDGNVVYDDQASATTDYWLKCTGLDAGYVGVGRNFAHDVVNVGISGGVTVDLGAGWGSGATASVTHDGSALQVAITTGSSPSANPTFDITLKAGPGEGLLMPVVQQVADSATVQSVHTLLSFVDRKFARITALVTPVNGQVLTFHIRF